MLASASSERHTVGLRLALRRFLIRLSFALLQYGAVSAAERRRLLCPVRRGGISCWWFDVSTMVRVPPGGG
jgi:hypothetical protein